MNTIVKKKLSSVPFLNVQNRLHLIRKEENDSSSTAQIQYRVGSLFC